MEISALTLKLILLLTPGGLSTLIYERLTTRKQPLTPFKFVINAIVFAIFSYISVDVFRKFINWFAGPGSRCQPLQIWDDIMSRDAVAHYSEAIWASLAAVILSFIVAKGDSDKWLNRLATLLKVSSKYGDENLFSYFLYRNRVEWIYVRVPSRKQTYLGKVITFSEADDHKEIHLKYVSIYDYDSSQPLYDVAELYLNLPNDDVVIEVPNPKPPTP